MCLSTAACLHYCTDRDVTWQSGRWCLVVVHCLADLQSVHGLCCYGNTKNAWQSPAVIRQAHHMPHALCMPAKSPLASDKIDAPAVCATLSATTPFHFVHSAGDVVTRTQDVSEYVLVLTLCTVINWQPYRGRLMVVWSVFHMLDVVLDARQWCWSHCQLFDVLHVNLA